MIFFKYRNVQQIQFTRFRQWIASCRGRLFSAAAQWTRDRNSEFRIKKGRLPALFGYAMVSMYLRMFDTLVIFSMLPSFATISVGAIFTPCSLANASLSSA